MKYTFILNMFYIWLYSRNFKYLINCAYIYNIYSFNKQSLDLEKNVNSPLKILHLGFEKKKHLLSILV
jgi:hypothetical protein